MDSSKPNPRALDYAGPMAKSQFDRLPFRWGVVSMTCSVFAAAGVPFCMFMRSGEAAYAVLTLIGLAGLGFGIGGMFKRYGRWMAIVGAIIAVVDVVLIPTLVPI